MGKPKKPKLATKPWPRLSETLTGPKHPTICQACSAGPSTGGMQAWQECDENDKPEPIAVMLCKGCAERLIEPHPRLYRYQSVWPGAMPSICLDCTWRDGATCTCPLSQMNGGPGMGIFGLSPVHVCRSPRRNSGWIYTGTPTDCQGKNYVQNAEGTRATQPGQQAGEGQQ